MMLCFDDTASAMQILLLVLSQFTVIFTGISIVFLFRRKFGRKKRFAMCAVFLANVFLYVLMQLSSRINGADTKVHLSVPYGALTAIILLSLIFNIWVIFSETGNRRMINHSSIKESHRCCCYVYKTDTKWSNSI